jgi:DNA-directed RNA polymerase
MLEAGIKPERWTPGERLRVGNWALDCCLQALPGIVIRGDWGEPQIADAEWATARELALVHMPKVFRPALKRPKAWTSFCNEDRQPFLRHCRDEQTANSFPIRRHMDAVSHLQSTAWRITEPVLKFIQVLGRWERPPLLGFNSRQSWRPRDRADWRVFDWDMYWAERLLARGRPFWTQMYCDFRGRVYAFPHFNFGRGDYVRSLFRFHHGAPITDRGIFWLKVATADPGLLDWFVPLVREAMEKALPGATKIMNFMRDIAEMWADAGKTLWMHSPTGVPVCNLEYKPDLRRPKLWLDNKEIRHWAVMDDLDEIDVAACKRGAAANLVHSLDASHLALVALACECADVPLACVHDSFATLPCHADELREILLRELRTMYENINPLQDIYDRARVALGPANRTWPILPSRGSLDLSQVTGPYAFS